MMCRSINYQELWKLIKHILFVQRKGKAILRHLKNGAGVIALIEEVEKYADKQAHIMTDQNPGYLKLRKKGYTHDWVTVCKRRYL